MHHVLGEYLRWADHRRRVAARLAVVAPNVSVNVSGAPARALAKVPPASIEKCLEEEVLPTRKHSHGIGLSAHSTIAKSGTPLSK